MSNFPLNRILGSESRERPRDYLGPSTHFVGKETEAVCYSSGCGKPGKRAGPLIRRSVLSHHVQSESSGMWVLSTQWWKAFSC